MAVQQIRMIEAEVQKN